MTLLDTHVVLWLLDDSPRLGAEARSLISRGGAHVSAVSLWELAIKSSLGKVRVPDELPHLIEASGLTLVGVEPAHAWGVREASGLAHRDPFDTMLVMQATLEGWSLVTADEQILAARDRLPVDLVDAQA